MAIVESQMSFLEPWLNKEEGPYVRHKVEESFPRSNFTNQEHSVLIHDARPTKYDFKLDTHGFAFRDDEPVGHEIVEAIRERNKPIIERRYYPLIENLVRKSTGATKVIIFDHTYRRRDPTLAPNENPNGKEQPATLVSV